MKLPTYMKSPQPSAKALIPFLCFFICYLSSGLWFTYLGEKEAFYQFPAPSCALIGFAVALTLGWKKISHYVDIFAKGIGDQTVVLMCLIFMLAGAFSEVTKTIGAVDSTVNFGLSLLHPSLLLPGIFLISCLISLAIGTSMGTIAAVVPIAVGIANTSGLDPALTTGTVLSGAMFGDNLSIISDTTIAATSTQACDMRSKMIANLWIAVPVAVIVCLLYWSVSNPIFINKAESYSLIKLLPYALILCLSLGGMNVIAVLMLGIFTSCVVGIISTDSFGLGNIGKTIYSGFESMSEVFYMTVLVSGLASIAAREGGIAYILEKLKKLMIGRKTAEACIAAIASLADLCVANNTIAIVITGSMTKEISSKFNIPAPRAASLLDIFSCIWQGLIPYGAQLLLAGALSGTSPFQIIPYAWYPFGLGIFATLSIVFQFPKKATLGKLDKLT